MAEPEQALSDPEKARLYYEQNPTHNVGLCMGRLEPVPWTSIMSEYTKLIFEELGHRFLRALCSRHPRLLGAKIVAS